MNQNFYTFKHCFNYYSSMSGILFGVFCLLIQSNQALEKSSKVLNIECQKIVTFLSIIFIAGYAFFATSCLSKTECNQTHPYISVFPVREH